MTEPVSWVLVGFAACLYVPVTAGLLLVPRDQRPTAWPLGALCWPLLAVGALLALVVCRLPRLHR